MKLTPIRQAEHTDLFQNSLSLFVESICTCNFKELFMEYHNQVCEGMTTPKACNRLSIACMSFARFLSP